MRAEPTPVSEPFISQGHVIKRSYDIVGRIPSREVIIAKLGYYKHSCDRDIVAFVCHVTLQKHMIKALYDFMIKSLSSYISIVASLVAIVTVVEEI